MTVQAHGKLVIAISSRALFDLDESHHIYENEGLVAYCAHQRAHESVALALAPGVAFPLVQKLLALNEPDPSRPRVEVILVSRNSADTGLRVFHSIREKGLDIVRAAFTGGASSQRYLEAFGAHLFLSADAGDVRAAIAAGYAAATILPSSLGSGAGGQLRIAFDGDAVLFSDFSERIYKQSGLSARK